MLRFLPGFSCLRGTTRQAGATPPTDAAAHPTRQSAMRTAFAGARNVPIAHVVPYLPCTSSRAPSTAVTIASADKIDRPYAALRPHAFNAIAAQQITPGENHVFETGGCLRSSAFIDMMYNGRAAMPAVDLLAAQACAGNADGDSATRLAQAMFVVGKLDVLVRSDTHTAMTAFQPAIPLTMLASDQGTPQTAIDTRLTELTRGMITHYPLGAMSETRPKLLNAFYVEGPWKHPFDRDDTRIGDFHKFDGTTSRVDMMCLRDVHMPVSRDIAGFSAVCMKALDAQGPHGTMQVLYALPQASLDAAAQAQAFNALLGTLAGSDDAVITLNLKSKQIDFAVPRFEIEATGDIQPYAGFSLADDAARVDAFAIRMRQRIRIQHDEGGFRAAAVTESDCYDGCGPRDPDRQVCLNRPFYALLLTQSGYPLLAMHVADPQAVDAAKLVAAAPPSPDLWWARRRIR